MRARIIIWDNAATRPYIQEIFEVSFRTPKGEVSRYFGQAMSNAEQQVRGKSHLSVSVMFSDWQGKFYTGVTP